MAVWLHVYGRNGLGKFDPEKVSQYLDIVNSLVLDETKILDSAAPIGASSMRKLYENNRKSSEAFYRAMTRQEYEDYLKAIGKPFMEIDELIKSSIIDAETKQNDNIKRFDAAYTESASKINRSKWKVEQETTESVFLVNDLNYFETRGLALCLYNDILSLSGPFEVFSKYFTFQREISYELREYYHNYFKSVLCAFKSDFMLYAHEWSGLVDEEDSEYDSNKILETVSLRMSDNRSLHYMDNMSSFCFEKLEPNRE